MLIKLIASLGYEFKDIALLKMALTHRSMEEENNERLEFLGDSIVNCIVADALYLQFPEANEGELSRWRASLINRDTLCDLARHLDIGSYLYLGQGEIKSGGADRPSILSCAMEAVIGAIFLDGGFSHTRDCVLRWYEPLLTSLSSARDHKDPKTQLQEYLQSRRLILPVYSVISVEGEAHSQTFMVKCHVASLHLNAEGQGSSRRRAEQDAAENMLRMINK